MAAVLPMSFNTAAKLFHPLDDSGSRAVTHLKHLSGCSKSFLLMNERGVYPLLLTRFQELDSLNSLLHFFKNVTRCSGGSSATREDRTEKFFFLPFIPIKSSISDNLNQKYLSEGRWYQAHSLARHHLCACLASSGEDE